MAGELTLIDAGKSCSSVGPEVALIRMSTLNFTALAVAIVICLAMALLGGILTGNSLKVWYVGLVKPRWQIPLWAFVTIGMIGYVMDAVILYRLLSAVSDPAGKVVALTAMIIVMLYNELWNYAFFGLRSTLAGFVGIVAFLAPLAILLVILVEYDPPSALLLLIYVVWVILYDIPWAYTLWKLNRVGQMS